VVGSERNPAQDARGDPAAVVPTRIGGLDVIFSAAQVEDALGPDTPACECPGCQSIVAIKGLICTLVTTHDTAQLAHHREMREVDPDMPAPAPAWLSVLMLAASRARAQGFSTQVIGSTVAQGVEQADLLNPHLHYTANSQDRPL
jgi:hypothetical protein